MKEIKYRKLKHYFEKGNIYFVTSVVKDRKKIFTDLKTTRFLLITIAYHKYVLNFLLFGYVIMQEHFHLLLQPCDKYDISRIMKDIKGNFSRKYNEFLNPTPVSSRHLNVGYVKGFKYEYFPVWQKEYYESCVRDEKDFVQKLNYIHNNPVKRGLVNSAEEYEFSSYHQYYGESRQKIQIPIDKILL
ncbi:MAG: transposase [Endomicrobiia bacterium]